MAGLGYIAQVAVLPAFAHARETSRLAALVSGDATKRNALGERRRRPGAAQAMHRPPVKEPEEVRVEAPSQ